MIKLLRQQKGAISLYILVMLMVACLILPVYAFNIEKLSAKTRVDGIQDTICVSVTSSYMSLMPEFYTDAILQLDEEVFKEKFNDLLLDNLRMEYPEIEIIEERIFTGEFSQECSAGKTFERAGVHIIVGVPVRYSLIGFFRPLLGGDMEKMKIHGDVMFSLDN